MNKGILVHLVAAIFCILAVLFIIGGDEVDMGGRFLILYFFGATQAVAWMICLKDDLYNKKL